MTFSKITLLPFIVLSFVLSAHTLYAQDDENNQNNTENENSVGEPKTRAERGDTRRFGGQLLLDNFVQPPSHTHTHPHTHIGLHVQLLYWFPCFLKYSLVTQMKTQFSFAECKNALNKPATRCILRPISILVTS